ncbi:MAG: BtpA/SgcQ family protein, partial [Candidatus Pacebacteria bacterium]|nr:BtpA/SgcQ family protein [Candidatus Paceibacterota bacterium]
EIWADIHVKHTKLIDKRTISESAKLALEKGADKLIITGSWTGKPPQIKDILEVKKILPQAYVIIGSGINKNNILKYKKYVNKIIIGSAFKKRGRVELKKVEEITKKAG